jgi:hypothetical protein
MLTKADYESLKSSVKGWDARKLRQYGIEWPPVHGWRQRLLREYRSGAATRAMPEKKLTKPEPTELELQQEEYAGRSRKLTCDWYLRISGQVPWRPGEKEVLDSQIETENGKWNHTQARIELSLG